MSINIRPCQDAAEMAAYRDVFAYVFAINEEDNLDNEVRHMQMEWTLCAFDDEWLVSTWAAYPFDVRLNGRRTPMAGVTAVGTLPGHRRRGLLRETMTAGLERARKDGQAYAILWASQGAIYQRFGFGLAAPCVSYRFDPARVETLPGLAPTGRCDLVNGSELRETLAPIYARYAERRNLLIERPDYLWEVGPLHSYEKRRIYAAVYRDADGDARGYVVYTTREDEAREPGHGPNQVVDVKDLAWLDVDAYRGIWAYLRGHELAFEITMDGLVGLDDPMPALLVEPRALNMTVADAIWMRVVDVERALSTRAYGDAGTVCIEVVDDLLPENSGRWMVSTDGESATVTATGREPDLVMPVATLATLLSGHRSATFCERAGMLEARNAASVRVADGMFGTTYAPLTTNEF